MKRNELIYILDDDEGYCLLLEKILRTLNFTNVRTFSSEYECLMSKDAKPKVLIVDYHLKFMSGIQFLQLFKKDKLNIYSILLSGEFHEDFSRVIDKRFLQYVDSYLIKGMNVKQELKNLLC